MALNMEAIGKNIGPLTRSYEWKDVVLYALGIGAGFDEIEYTFEKNLKVIPTFSIAMIFDFFWQVAAASNINLTGILHGEQEIIFHHPIPPSGTMTTEGKITHYYDKGPKGALVVAESDTHHGSGKKLFTSIFTLFGRLDGGFGGKDSPPQTIDIPDREPDAVVEATPSPDQPLIYRLSGDIFPLHADPEFAKKAGFEKPIMHGLCTFGFAGRALMARLTPGKPENVRRVACRFSQTLYPGEPINTMIWETEKGKAVWRTVNARTGDIVIDRGVFEYGPAPKDEIRFDGRVAVVTGGGGGLGRVYALELARRGARVVVNDFGGARDGSKEGSGMPADAVVQEIRDMGGEAAASYDSVTTAEGGENIVKTALQTYGRVDILINNAGILRDKSFTKMDPETWRGVLDVHLHGAYHVTRPAFAAMRENGYGRIVMTTSAAGLYGNFGQANYSAAKMGLVGLMNTLKIEGAKYNIKVNTVAPIAATRLTEDVLPPDLKEKMTPECVGPLVMYLCSEECEETGIILNVGAGFISRASIFTGPGVHLGDGAIPPTPEDIRGNWDKINGMEGAGPLSDATSAVISFAMPHTEKQGDISDKETIPDMEHIFRTLPDAFNAGAAAGKDVVFQFRISGPGGGNWIVAVKDSACRVEKGTAEKATTTISMAAGDFISLITGNMTGMEAYTAGKLKVEGDMMKAQLVEKLFTLKR